MAVNYTWEITGMRKNPSVEGMEDVITSVSFLYSGVNEDNITGSFSGAVTFPTPDSENFIAFDEVTKENVVSWITEQYSQSAMQDSITKEIQDKVNPPEVDCDLPWSE